MGVTLFMPDYGDSRKTAGPPCLIPQLQCHGRLDVISFDQIQAFFDESLSHVERDAARCAT